MMLRVVTVLRSGAEFLPEHARALRQMVQMHTTEVFEFVCLTDLPGQDPSFLPLQHDWPGWWSMVEMFRVPGPAIYFDLDTVIVGDLDPLATAVMALKPDEAILLRQLMPMRTTAGLRLPWTTGVTAWGGDLRGITEEFALAVAGGKFNPPHQRGGMTRAGSLLASNRRVYKTDEQWTPEQMQMRGIKIKALQDVVPGVVQSYKYDVRPTGNPPTAPIVMFHGKPRPWDLHPMPEWMP